MTADRSILFERPAAPLPLDEAVAIIRRFVRPVAECETLLLGTALGRSLANPVHAGRSLPPFDNTAVDGYAFCHADAPPEGSATLRLAGESAAGLPFAGAVGPGMAVRISTGAVLPGGADTVAMQEDCRVKDGHLVIDPVPLPGANIRLAGADIREGAVALPAGHRLRPQDIALLRALGSVEARVRRRLKVAVAPTGAELREAGAVLGPGQIVESNGLMLAQLLSHFPADVTLVDPLPDDRAATELALAQLGADHDLVITTGGVSVGDHDHVRPALLARGRVHFWRIAVRPGKPVLFGEVGGAAVLGLPGNPVSAFVTFLMVAVPLIDGLLGASGRELPGYFVPLAVPLAKSPGLREFPRVRLVRGQVVPYHDQSSNLLTSLTWADGILDLPVGPSELQAGHAVLYRPFGALMG